jgi:hypothetical protein
MSSALKPHLTVGSMRSPVQIGRPDTKAQQNRPLFVYFLYWLHAPHGFAVRPIIGQNGLVGETLVLRALRSDSVKVCGEVPGSERGARSSGRRLRIELRSMGRVLAVLESSGIAALGRLALNVRAQGAAALRTSQREDRDGTDFLTIFDLEGRSAVTGHLAERFVG